MAYTIALDGMVHGHVFLLWHVHVAAKHSCFKRKQLCFKLRIHDIDGCCAASRLFWRGMADKTRPVALYLFNLYAWDRFGGRDVWKCSVRFRNDHRRLRSVILQPWCLRCNHRFDSKPLQDLRKAWDVSVPLSGRFWSDS